LKVSSANGIQRCDMASIDEDQARYSDKLVVLADKRDTSGQFQNRVDLSRLEVSFLCNNSRVFVSHFHSEGSVPAQIP